MKNRRQLKLQSKSNQIIETIEYLEKDLNTLKSTIQKKKINNFFNLKKYQEQKELKS